MLKFTIHLRSIDDFQKYVALLKKYTFCGYIQGRGFSMDVYDILELFSYCPLENLQLHIHVYRKEEAASLRKFLDDSGLTDYDPNHEKCREHIFQNGGAW